MSQTAFRTQSSYGQKGRPAWRVDMPWWAWLLTAFAVAATLAFEVVWWWFAQFDYGGCGSPPETGDLHDGQLALAVLWGGVSLAWLLPAWLSRFRVPVVLAGVLCSAVAAGIFGYGLSPTAWRDGFCF
jgi:hypothetical protein